MFGKTGIRGQEYGKENYAGSIVSRSESYRCNGGRPTGSSVRLRQATTNYWKEKFARFGKEIIYLEFEYPWQEGMNRLFVCLPELKVPEDSQQEAGY